MRAKKKNIELSSGCGLRLQTATALSPAKKEGEHVGPGQAEKLMRERKRKLLVQSRKVK